MLIILLALIVVIIYQFIRIKKRQTIEVFKKLCEKIFEDSENDF